MPYIGNSIKQVIKPTTESKFEELEAISLDSSGVKTIDLAQAEVSVNDSPVDHFNVSLNETVFDLQHRKFRKLDMSTIEAQIGVVDFGFVPSL